MKYSVMTYKEGKFKFNIGDYIQSLAAKQFLPDASGYVNREELGKYAGDESKIILNGWFTHEPDTWIPSEKLKPLFISFHVNSSAAKRMLNDSGVRYLKRFEPIGCRDYYTVRLLNEKGVKAYFSGCLTLTLDSYSKKTDRSNGEIYIVDPLYGFPNKSRVFNSIKSTVKNTLNGNIFHLNSANKYMRQIFSKSLLDRAKYIEQELPSNKYSEEEKFLLADEMLSKYSAAKLVITSRIHCALPCLAMGTPVIYLNGFEQEFDACRMEGLSGLFNVIDVNRRTGEITSNFKYKGLIDENTEVENKKDYLELANLLSSKVNEFIKS